MAERDEAVKIESGLAMVQGQTAEDAVTEATRIINGDKSKRNNIYEVGPIFGPSEQVDTSSRIVNEWFLEFGGI